MDSFATAGVKRKRTSDEAVLSPGCSVSATLSRTLNRQTTNWFPSLGMAAVICAAT
jgi:hypothetical protein